MSEQLLIGLATIVALGMTAQWIAWRLHLPAILLLLLFGLLAGPVLHWINPDEIFGELLFPVVSFSVAIILFEGGLSLKFSDLRSVGGVVRNLATVGVGVAWVLCSVGAYLFTEIGFGLSVLLGAVLVVSGPTVIGPLLRQVRPTRDLAAVIKWEGIVNDPTGAILAVLVFEVMIAGGFGEGLSAVVGGILKALAAGVAIGFVSSWALVKLLKRHLIPDFLQSPLTLMLVVISYVTANELQTESGLLAVTAMGVALANQKSVSVKQITEFKENLRVLLLAGLFIILSARLPGIETLSSISSWMYVGFLIIVARPLTILFSTLGSSLSIKERLFLGWMAPRGIVAAAVTSIFALRLQESGFVGAEAIVPLTFTVIIGTVAVYGLSATFVARRLKVASPNPQGVLFVGADFWAREIALALGQEGLNVVMVDTNWSHVATAKSAGIPAVYANALDEDLTLKMHLDGIGRMFAVTPNDEINSLAVLHFEDVFGSAESYQLFPVAATGKDGDGTIPKDLRGRYLFEKGATYDDIVARFREGFAVKRTPLTDEFDFEAFKVRYGGDAMPLMVITASRALKVFCTELQPEPQAGDVLVSLVRPLSDDSSSHESDESFATK